MKLRVIKMRNKNKKFLRKNWKSIIVVLVFIIAIVVFIAESRREKGKVTSTDFSSELERRIDRLASKYPIREMIPYISQKDRLTAAFLVAIAKKESNWGKNSPRKDGRDCYNYWGYRGTYNQTDSGYSCFDNPEQAVNEVGGRIEELISQKIDTPAKMVLAWKCGWDCSGHSFWSVKKWEWDVGFYFRKIYDQY
jgi:hypothetical protein